MANPDFAPLEDSLAGSPNDAPPGGMKDADWLALSRTAYEGSTDYFQNNVREAWDNALEHMAGRHAANSKYHSDLYAARSKIFRPKTRSAIRKAEAAAAAAFFATQDVVSVKAQDDSNPADLASAEINNELLNYRLTRTIPWFLVCMGAFQDTKSVGICVSLQYWRMEKDANGKKTLDEPCIELLAPENVRFDPGADWTDPINTSPYVIRLVPMFVHDVKERMKQGEWRTFPESTILEALDLNAHSEDRVQHSRDGRTQRTNDNQEINDYKLVWARECFFKRDGTDWHYWTLGEVEMLTDVVPVDQIYWHANKERPIVLGYGMIEAHKTYPMGTAEMGKGLQAEANDIANQRLDNVKLAMNGRYFARQGAAIDGPGLARNVPGSVVWFKDPEKDIRWERPPDVTSSSYEEQDRINADYDELCGNFSTSSVQTNRQLNDTVGGMQLMSGGANALVEYDLRVFSETWVEKVLRQLLHLEQKYESDSTVLALAGKQAQLFQRFGIQAITDDILERDLSLHVDVGVGATDPLQQLHKFTMAMTGIAQLFGPNVVQDINKEEVIKEVFGKAGYKDGMRFFNYGDQQSAEVKDLQQKLQQAAQIIQQLSSQQAIEQGKVQADLVSSQAKVQAAQIGAQAQTQQRVIAEQGAGDRAKLQAVVDVRGQNIQAATAKMTAAKRANGQRSAAK